MISKKTTLKGQYEKLTERLNKSLDQVNKLTETTPTPAYAAVPDPNILKNLLDECEDSDFWQNFKKAAPIMFCVSIEEDQNLRQISHKAYYDNSQETDRQ